MLLILLFCPAIARAEAPELAVSGHIKNITAASFFREPIRDVQPSPLGQAATDARLNVDVKASVFRFQVHHAVTTTIGGATANNATLSTGVGRPAPEIVDLTWVFSDEGASSAVQGRTDRLLMQARLPGIDLTIGRQPVTFGSAMIFSPRDLVNPFFPTTLDTEYKPGVDALRLDAYRGLSRITAVAAYARNDGELDELADVNLALDAQLTLGITDISLFGGAIRADQVVGGGLVSSIGPVGIQGDITYTVPHDEEAPFWRGVVGANGRPTEKLYLLGEVYIQTLGETDPTQYLSQLTGERYAVGELWTVGRSYAAVSATHQVHPLASLSAAVITNLHDPSALLSPTLHVSVSNNVDAFVGAYVGLGEQPVLAGSTFTPNSEFGLYPTTAFSQVRAYF